jgi:hypothetical protein
MENNTNELTFTMGKLQFIGPVFGIMLVSLLVLPYFLIYGLTELEKVRDFFNFKIFIPSIVIGIIIHEFIHGYTWAKMADIGLKNIKFGFQLKTLTPYAHSKVPMKVKAYRIGTVMPFILLGILPYFYAIYAKHPLILGFGIFFSFVAIGDVMILWLIRKLPNQQLVQDHPTKAGVILFDNN